MLSGKGCCMAKTHQTIDVSVSLGTSNHPRQIPLVIHPSKQDGVIVINYPGFNGDISGFNDKYKKVANFVSGRCEIGTVVRMGNHYEPMLDYSDSVIDDLAAVMKFCRERSEEFCRAVAPRFYLMGFSSGAGAIAAIAGENKDVEKVLLVAPSGDASRQRVTTSLKKYTGELYAVVGDHDEVVGREAAQIFSAMAPNASINKVHVVPNCDHQFKGETNGYVMSVLPKWAFSNGGKENPDPSEGVKLY
jgi:dienelactone hydrolase